MCPCKNRGIRAKANVILLYVFAVLYAAPSYANRYISCDDMGYENCGGEIGVFGTLILLAIGAVAIVSFFTNKGFRRGVLWYVFIIVGMAVVAGWLSKEFGKHVGVLSILALGLLYWKLQDPIFNLFFGADSPESTPNLSSKNSQIRKNSPPAKDSFVQTKLPSAVPRQTPLSVPTAKVERRPQDIAPVVEKWKFNGYALERGISLIPLASLKISEGKTDGFEVKDPKYPHVIWINSREIDADFNEICRQVRHLSGWQT